MEEDFRRKILKLDKPRVHKIKNSWGIYDAFKYIRKNKWFNIGLPLKEHLFYAIIRKVNLLLADRLYNLEDIVFPHKMGKLEVRKYNRKVSIKNGKIVTNLPIDWDSTLKLWAEDEEAYKNKTLIKLDEKEIFKVYYNKLRADFTNKGYYQFEPNRDLKILLKNRIKRGGFDAFLL